MPVPFNQTPSNIRTPFVTAEFDSSQANQGPALLAYRALLIGQKTSAGSWPANSLQLVTNADQVAAGAGRGSMLHNMAKAYFAVNKSTETWVGVLGDNGAGAAATGTLTVTGPATATGTLVVYVGGVAVPVAVTSGDTANTIAANINAAINAVADLPATATVATNVVTVTFRHKGLVGNTLDVRLNYNSGDATPAGVAVAIVALSGGTSNPDMTTLIANMGDTWFHVWAHPYTDSGSLTALETELASRAGPMRMIDGVALTAQVDTLANLATLGNGRNSQFTSILGLDATPTLPACAAANLVAQVAFYGAQDPARPFQTLPLAQVLPAAQPVRYTQQERNTLLYDGISTSKVDAGGNVLIERLITTYKTNAQGTADTSYLDLTTNLNLMYLRFAFRARVASKYPRAKLGDNGVRAQPGQVIMTPDIGKAEAVLWFKDMIDLGLVEDLDGFKANLVVQRNATDRNRLDFLLPPTLIGQLIVAAADIQFRF